MSRTDKSITMLAYAIMGFVCGWLAMQAGCSNKEDLHSRPQDDTAYAERSITKIVDRADAIEDNAAQIQKRTPRASLLRIIENVQAIKFNATAIREDVDNGLHALGEADKKIQGLQATNTTLAQDRDQWKAKAESSLRKAAGGGVGIGILCVALSAAVFFGGYTKAAKMGGAFGATLTLAGMLVGWYSLWLMLTIVVPLGIGLSIFIIKRMRNESWSTYRNAGVIEALKEKMEPDDRADFFGVGAGTGEIDQLDAKLGVPMAAKELTQVARETLPATATPLAVTAPVVTRKR